jgi:hypothetical protein
MLSNHYLLIKRVNSRHISSTSTLTFQVVTYNIPTFLSTFLIRTTNMSNLFMIAAQALKPSLPSTLDPAIIAT